MVHENNCRVAALIAGALAVTATGLMAADDARAAERPVARKAAKSRPVRTAGGPRPLTIRRRAARPVAVVAPAPGVVYAVPQHGWNDPRLYYFGPFRTGGEVFYGDQAGNPITRGNAQLGMISGYGGARGGFGGPHFDAVGGFHDGPGPDAAIDADYASGSLSRPDYAVAPRYASLKQRVAALNEGVVPRGALFSADDRLTGRRLTANGRSNAEASEQAKAAFAAPMPHADPNEGLPGGQPLPSLGDLGDF